MLTGTNERINVKWGQTRFFKRWALFTITPTEKLHWKRMFRCPASLDTRSQVYLSMLSSVETIVRPPSLPIAITASISNVLRMLPSDNPVTFTPTC
jgi:hypothetical protein